MGNTSGSTTRSIRHRPTHSNYSESDIYRAPIPLLALLAPDATSDCIMSLVADAAQDGWPPKWSVANRTRDIMFGDPADPIIASAYAFGATHFDTTVAFAAMVKGATESGSASDGYVERPYLDTNLRQGYVPAEAPWSAATTLEYTTADFSIARFAQALGQTDTAAAYMRQAQNWQTIYNPASGYAQPRLSTGVFSANFDPASQVGFDENNAAQYTWLVPYNLRGLFAAMGGNTVAVQRLDSFFSQLNAGADAPYEWLGNEPGLGVPWAYDFAGAPWRTQEVVHQALDELYSVTPGGIPGNDDLGTLSAWYVWAALGLYPAVPGVGGFTLSTPLFPRITPSSRPTLCPRATI